MSSQLLQLYELFGVEESIVLMNKAMEMAQKNPNVTLGDIQDTLKTGYEGAETIFDWLADNYKAEPRISNHWIRCGRTYVMNNENTSLEEMCDRLSIGHRTGFLVMMKLNDRGIIKIKNNFVFERIKPGTNEEGFARQIKKYAKKYRGRCEPELLERLLFLDYPTAFYWAEYGRDKLGFRWRGPWKNVHTKIEKDPVVEK